MRSVQRSSAATMTSFRTSTTRRCPPRDSVELDLEKGLEMRKWVLSGILASEETYLNHLEALLLLYDVHKEFYDGLLPRVQQWSHHQRVGELFHKLRCRRLHGPGLIAKRAKRAFQMRRPRALTSLQTQGIRCHGNTSGPKAAVAAQWRGGGFSGFFAVTKSVVGSVAFREAPVGKSIGLQPGNQNPDLRPRIPWGNMLASQLGLYRAFVDNYKVAVETAEKCCQANAQFAEISEDLLKHTPCSHHDHPLLQDALRISQSFLSSINEEITPRRQPAAARKGENRQLVKDSYVVELVEGARKLRHIFLFTDMLLCAKLKKQTAGKTPQYDSKWYIPLSDLTFQAGEESDTPPIPQVPDEEIDSMKAKISHIRAELQREKGTSKGVKAMERMKKKLSEQESLLLLSCPNMPLRIHNRNGKVSHTMPATDTIHIHSYMFLISSDYERTDWKDIIREQQKKYSESPGLYGSLNVIVHSASGLKQSLNLYCALEVDSFGYFTNKAKTRVYRYTTEPNWNEEFEIELEGSQFLRLLCYEKSYNRNKLNKEDGESTDRIMAKGQIKLDPQTLQGKDWQRTVIAMNGIEVKISVKFTSRELSPKRRSSPKETGVFGVRISAVTKRERSKVPYIVRQCLEEIERRGLEEVGIYRVSGVATDIQTLKAAFDANNTDVSVMMGEMDVNAIAGTLKLYFRELPEPLFTDELYSNFAGGIALSDSVAKESCMLNLLLSLPEPNLLTFLFLLDHLKRVAEKESINKMSLHNLATVFGPTLLRPSEKDSKIPTNPTQPISMGDSWSLEVMAQVQVLLYFLQLETIPTPDSKRQSILFSTEV
ncbi:hypothetical protein JZ751_005477 [Albula glossodonta]|uniref:Breakpoint cluster region protein n=1 Tax=Albula glossodonta TaxID=121402 RepID=A0A8T2MQC0_9TELE|nr:hypothetical protein JZ751_005477 [Albula glossodonta]